MLPGLIMVGGRRFEPRGWVLQLNRIEGVAGRSAESSWRSSGRAQQLQELARIGRICEKGLSVSRRRKAREQDGSERRGIE